jgi:type II secretory ATPase GspE/PulE/Tfp pilus assembly ATPase PilB-like protein
MDADLKAKLTSRELSVSDFKKQGDVNSRKNLKKEAMRKVLRGLTTIDEVKRVISNL